MSWYFNISKKPSRSSERKVNYILSSKNIKIISYVHWPVQISWLRIWGASPGARCYETGYRTSPHGQSSHQWPASPRCGSLWPRMSRPTCCWPETCQREIHQNHKDLFFIINNSWYLIWSCFLCELPCIFSPATPMDPVWPLTSELGQRGAAWSPNLTNKDIRSALKIWNDNAKCWKRLNFVYKIPKHPEYFQLSCQCCFFFTAKHFQQLSSRHRWRHF